LRLQVRLVHLQTREGTRKCQLIALNPPLLLRLLRLRLLVGLLLLVVQEKQRCCVHQLMAWRDTRLAGDPSRGAQKGGNATPRRPDLTSSSGGSLLL
jgi:hypothetical protein